MTEFVGWRPTSTTGAKSTVTPRAASSFPRTRASSRTSSGVLRAAIRRALGSGPSRPSIRWTRPPSSSTETATGVRETSCTRFSAWSRSRAVAFPPMKIPPTCVARTVSTTVAGSAASTPTTSRWASRSRGASAATADAQGSGASAGLVGAAVADSGTAGAGGAAAGRTATTTPAATSPASTPVSRTIAGRGRCRRRGIAPDPPAADPPGADRGVRGGRDSRRRTCRLATANVPTRGGERADSRRRTARSAVAGAPLALSGATAAAAAAVPAARRRRPRHPGRRRCRRPVRLAVWLGATVGTAGVVAGTDGVPGPQEAAVLSRSPPRAAAAASRRRVGRSRIIAPLCPIFARPPCRDSSPKTQLRSTANRARPPRTLAAATVTDSCRAVGSSTSASSRSSTAEE